MRPNASASRRRDAPSDALARSISAGARARSAALQVVAQRAALSQRRRAISMALCIEVRVSWRA